MAYVVLQLPGYRYACTLRRRRVCSRSASDESRCCHPGGGAYLRKRRSGKQRTNYFRLLWYSRLSARWRFHRDSPETCGFGALLNETIENRSGRTASKRRFFIRRVIQNTTASALIFFISSTCKSPASPISDFRCKRNLRAPRTDGTFSDIARGALIGILG